MEGVKEIPQERFPEQTLEPRIVEEIAEVLSSSHAAAHAAPIPVNEYVHLHRSLPGT